MQLPLNWLKEYVDIKNSPEKLADLLTMAGIEVVAQTEQASEKIFEIEITPNRPDWLSIIGLSREIAAINGSKLKIKPVSKLKSEIKERNVFSVAVENKKDCPLYSARLIWDCDVKSSNSKMIARIESMGLRPVNNAVDITNFCLFETGQPMHAFDFDKIEGGKVIVRRAKNGETITTIDGNKRTLDPRILIIADAKKPIAVAGIMGGKYTEVTGTTKNILLESAYFDPVLIRRACRMLGLSSDSSYRFERKVDFNNVVLASNRASKMLKDICSGKIGELKAVQVKRKSSTAVNLGLKEINVVLGLDLGTSEVKNILSRLEFQVKPAGKDNFKVTAPSFREDVTCKEDLIEEIARIHGYDKIPTQLPLIKAYLSNEPRLNLHWLLEELRRQLTAQGLTEAITYSLAGVNLVSAFSSHESLIKVANPLSAEQAFMRPMILPGLLQAIQRNKNRQEADVNLFELGNVYKAIDGVKEITCLAIAISGNLAFDWKNKAKKADIFVLKGIVEAVLGNLGAGKCDFSVGNYDFLEPAMSLNISAHGQDLGLLGQVSAQVLSSVFDLKDAVFVLEIDLEKVLKSIQRQFKFQPLPKFPLSRRDISLVVKEEIKYAQIVEVIKKQAGSLLKEVEFIDEYQGKSIPAGQKSLTYSLIYQSNQSTLTENEVNSCQEKVLNALKQDFNAELRSL